MGGRVRSPFRSLPLKGAICEPMTPEEKAALSAHCEVLELSRDEIALDSATASTRFFIVHEGIIGIEHFLSDGRRVLSELCFEGDAIDCRHVLRRFDSAAVALTDARICTLDGATLEKIRCDSPAVDRALAAQVREQVHSLRDHCVDVSRKTPTERVASFLFELMRRLPEHCRKPGAIQFPLTLPQVGDYLSLQPETVSRSMSRLATDGLIAVTRAGTFRLADEDGLRRLADGDSPRQRKTRGQRPPAHSRRCRLIAGGMSDDDRHGRHQPQHEAGTRGGDDRRRRGPSCPAPRSFGHSCYSFACVSDLTKTAP